MSPKLNLSAVMARNGCTKPGCKRVPTYRHHRGSEHMWVTQFQHKTPRKTYIDFVNRYKQFHPNDCVELCGDHHEEIHDRYWHEIHGWIQRHPKLLKPFEFWTWAEAHRLMNHLRGVCDEWIKRPTPGSKERRYTTYD